MPSDLTSGQIKEYIRRSEHFAATTRAVAGKMHGDSKLFPTVTTNFVTGLLNVVRQLQEENAALRKETGQRCNSCDIAFPDKRSYVDHVKVEHPC